MKQFLLHFFTWWNGANLNTLFYTRRHGELVGSDEFGNAYYQTRGGAIDPGARIRAALGDLQRPSRSLDDAARLERLAASHGRHAADRGELQPRDGSARIWAT